MADGITKLQVTAYADGDFTKPVAGPLSVTVNPDKYTHSYQIKYTDPQAQGSTGASPRFNKIAAEKVNFELVFDGTGVIAPPTPAPPQPVSKQIEAFKGIVFDYSGKIHSPKYVKLNWGTLLFRCRLSSLDFTYKLFKPDGSPLRATARAAFIGYTDEEELARQANKSSPDLTHLVMVKAGDTLPLMCWNVYGTSTPYLQVAAVNELVEFRNLRPGSQLLFPPLVEVTG
jgi:hypothetical protein